MSDIVCVGAHREETASWRNICLRWLHVVSLKCTLNMAGASVQNMEGLDCEKIQDTYYLE